MSLPSTPTHRTLYCTCSGDGTIQQIKLDDPKLRTILTTQGCWFGLAVDTSADRLDCVQSSRGAIYRAGLDGSDEKHRRCALPKRNLIFGLAHGPSKVGVRW